jgi:hypothetical protein
MELPLREQGTMLTAVRAGDLTPKDPVDSFARQLHGYLRWVVLVAFDPREVDFEPGCFMQSTIHWNQTVLGPSELGHYPLHYFAHVMHAYEVVAYRHPDSTVAATALDIYSKMVRSLHLRPETKEDMIARLSEDRIATGVVVS